MSMLEPVVNVQLLNDNKGSTDDIMNFRDEAALDALPFRP